MKRLFAVLVAVIFILGCNVYSADKISVKDLKIKAEKQGWKAKDHGKKFKLGLKGHGKKMPKTPVRIKRIQALPGFIDYRNEGFVSTIKDQGDCGSCWAFSATGVLESAWMYGKNLPNTNLDLSEQIVVSCDTVNEGCNGGYMDVVADFMVNSGTGLESCYPYTATNGRCANACADKSAYRAVSWGYAATYDPDLTSIKSALVTYGPLISTLAVYSDFMYYESGVYKYTEGWLEGYHAIIIIGYDDAGQYFIVKNSWGTEWGEDGYFRIAYSELSSKVGFGEETIYLTVVGEPIPPPEPDPDPTPGCNSSSNTSGANKIEWFWNLFK